jgi:hypothetical protein
MTQFCETDVYHNVHSETTMSVVGKSQKNTGAEEGWCLAGFSQCMSLGMRFTNWVLPSRVLIDWPAIPLIPKAGRRNTKGCLSLYVTGRGGVCLWLRTLTLILRLCYTAVCVTNGCTRRLVRGHIFAGATPDRSKARLTELRHVSTPIPRQLVNEHNTTQHVPFIHNSACAKQPPWIS